MGVTVLDTSVLIALVDADDPHHAAARTAVRSRREAGDDFVVPVAAYAEFLVRSYQGDPSMIAFRDGLVDAIPARVEAATREMGRHAAAIRARDGQRMKLPDALIVATAIVLGAERILTADARWPVQDVSVTVLEAS